MTVSQNNNCKENELMAIKNRLYRALPLGIGDWVFGSLVDNGPNRSFIITDHINKRIPIKYESIGMYVPYLDAFEGDTLLGTKRNSNGNIIHRWEGIVSYIEDKSRIMVIDDLGKLYEVDDFQYDTVMGNIHRPSSYFREQVINPRLVMDLLDGAEAVVCKETAAALLGLSVPTLQNSIYVYSLVELGISGVKCIIVSSLDSIPHINRYGLRITDKLTTLNDLLNSETDSEILYSSLANFYKSDYEAFEAFLSLLPDEIFEKYLNFEDSVTGYWELE